MIYTCTCTVHLSINPPWYLSNVYLTWFFQVFSNPLHVHVYYFLVPNPFPMYAVPALFYEGCGLGIRSSCSGQWGVQGGAVSRWCPVCGVQLWVFGVRWCTGQSLHTGEWWVVSDEEWGCEGVWVTWGEGQVHPYVGTGHSVYKCSMGCILTLR